MLPIAVRQFSSSAIALSKINNVAIIGAGMMGSGIAQISANAKMNVMLYDTSDEALNKATKTIDSSLRRIAKKKYKKDKATAQSMVTDALARLKITKSVVEAVQDADLVVEAIVENIDIKQKLFAEVEKSAKSSAILTTNTSSLRLVDIGKNLKRKHQFGGLHFFNPVPLMKLLEIVRHDETSDTTFNTLVEYGEAVGKTTVECKDTPGFIVNRLLVPYMFEAIRMAERGDASFRDIDTAMKLGAGYPMGPFELLDYCGLDVDKFIMDGWVKKYPNEAIFKTSKLLDKLVEEGKLGMKTGEGFYKYPKKH